MIILSNNVLTKVYDYSLSSQAACLVIQPQRKLCLIANNHR